VTANDVPYFQQSNVPAVVQVTGMRITLPLYEPPGTGPVTPAPVTPPADAQAGPRLPATGGEATSPIWWALGVASLAGLLVLRAARGQQATAGR